MSGDIEKMSMSRVLAMDGAKEDSRTLRRMPFPRAKFSNAHDSYFNSCPPNPRAALCSNFCSATMLHLPSHPSPSQSVPRLYVLSILSICGAQHPWPSGRASCHRGAARSGQLIIGGGPFVIPPDGGAQ